MVLSCAPVEEGNEINDLQSHFPPLNVLCKGDHSIQHTSYHKTLNHPHDNGAFVCLAIGNMDHCMVVC